MTVAVPPAARLSAAGMTAEEYRAVIDELGLSQVKAARLLGFHERTSRRWALGEQEVPPPAAVALRLLRALAEIERLRLATDEGPLARRADRMWEIACEAQGRLAPGAKRFLE
jgi:hypothetical protein